MLRHPIDHRAAHSSFASCRNRSLGRRGKSRYRPLVRTQVQARHRHLHLMLATLSSHIPRHEFTCAFASVPVSPERSVPQTKHDSIAAGGLTISHRLGAQLTHPSPIYWTSFVSLLPPP